MKTGTILLLFFYFLLLMMAGIACRAPQKTKMATVIEQLMEGNHRFASMHQSHPHDTKQRRVEISEAQHPFAAIICCSDSRVPPELVFDQGLGDLFVVRTAGNLMSGLEIGSIEYAVEHLGVKEVIIMGHKECGALKAFAEGGTVSGHIKDIVDSIKSEQEIRQLPANDKNLLNDCIRANVLHGMHQLKLQSTLLASRINKNELQVLGACYDMRSGVVELIQE